MLSVHLSCWAALNCQENFSPVNIETATWSRGETFLLKLKMHEHAFGSGEHNLYTPGAGIFCRSALVPYSTHALCSGWWGRVYHRRHRTTPPPSPNTSVQAIACRNNAQGRKTQFKNMKGLNFASAKLVPNVSRKFVVSFFVIYFLINSLRFYQKF